MDSYITYPYQKADHYCRITWMYNKLIVVMIINQYQSEDQNKDLFLGQLSYNPFGYKITAIFGVYM